MEEMKLKAMLTPTQYKYYTDYLYNNMRLWQIADKYGVDITTVCRVIKTARKNIIKYGGADIG